MDRPSPTFTNVCEATSQSHELDYMRPIHRKGKKLLAEKKRRARINNCLIQIRDLVFEGEDDKDSDIDKMEKAEILEKTLEVLTRLRREYNTVNFSSCGGSPSSLHSSSAARQFMAVRYASGFSSCAEESIRYIQNSRLVPAEVKAQLQNHLRSIALRMENRAVESAARPTVSSPTAHYPHQFSGHPFHTPPSSVYPHGELVTDHVTTSVQQEDESALCFRIPSPIHSSTPVTTYSHPQDQENIPENKILSPSSEVQVSLQASYGYDSVTPEIDVVAGNEDTNESAFSQSQTHRQQLYQLPALTLDYANNSPRLPLTSTPIYSSPQQTFQTPHPSLHKKRGSLQTFHMSTVFSTPSTTQPYSAFSSPTTSPLSQTVFIDQGYESLPTTSVATTATQACQCLYPLSSATANTLSSPDLARSSEVKPHSALSMPALDLCVKKQGSQQISPDVMWRPW